MRFFSALLLALALSLSPASAHLRFQVFVTGAAVTTTSATAVNVTGLAMPAISGVDMWFRCKLPVTSSLVTSRVRFDLSGPASTAFRMAIESYGATTTIKEFDIVTAVSTLSAVGNTPTTVTVTTLEGVLRPSAAGTYQVRLASETAGQTSTVEIGSVCEYSYER